MTNYFEKLKLHFFATLIFIVGFVFSLNATTYYSDPTSSNVILSNAPLTEGWSTSAAGPFNVAVTINKGDHIVIQKGSTVTAVGSGLTFNNYIFEGGTLVISASSINAIGNITGTGVYKTALDVSTRIKMQGGNKLINANLTGNAGITIGRNVMLTGNTTIGGRISIDSAGSLDLAGFSLMVDNFIMKGGALLKSNNAQLTIQSATAGTSILIFDEAANKLSSFTINNPGGAVLKSSMVSENLTLTNGKISLGNYNLTFKNLIGGNETSFVVTDGTGALISTVSAGTAKVFPVGAANEKKYSALDAVSVTPSKESTFSVGVKNTFSNQLENSKKAAGREWSIRSTNPSATVVSFSPKYGVSPKVAVVGMFADGSWSEIPATRSGTTFTATVSKFALFGVGEQGAFINASK